jgi:hypothetical protein
MNKLSLDQFYRAINATHGGKATYLRRQRVLERFSDQTWDGEVLVFTLKHHATTSICYAWETEGRVTAVLHDASVNSPEAAVRAVIAAEHQAQ